MKRVAALWGAAALLAFTTSPAEARRFTQWYFGVDGGASWVEDIDVSTYTNPPGPPGVAQTNTVDQGWAAFATAGYAFNNNWRVELEGGYRANEFDTNIIGGVETPMDGDIREYTAMANVLYDFESFSDLVMSLGLGVGGDYSRVSTVAPTSFHDSQTALAFQALAGFSYPVTSWMDLTLNYRYLYVTDVTLTDDSVAPTSVIETDPIRKHTVTLGLRFGGRSRAPMMNQPAAAPPPPPPPPAPQVARQYVIFFGFNKCNITADADDVLSEAAASARKIGSTSIKIVGHTDTVGTQAANQILSECRANATKMNLVSKGIAPGMISAVGRGETQLLVQTPDNVKEPQNRRATVDL